MDYIEIPYGVGLWTAATEAFEEAIDTTGRIIPKGEFMARFRVQFPNKTQAHLEQAYREQAEFWLDRIERLMRGEEIPRGVPGGYESAPSAPPPSPRPVPPPAPPRERGMWTRNIPYGFELYDAASRVFSEAINTPAGQLPEYGEFKNLLRRSFPSAFEPALALAYSDQVEFYDDLVARMRSGLPLPTPRRIPGRYNERSVPLPRPVPPPSNPIYGDAIHGGAAMFFEMAAERGGVPNYKEFIDQLSNLVDATPEQKEYLDDAYRDFMNYWRPILLAVSNGDTRYYDAYFRFRGESAAWEPTRFVGDSGYGNSAYLEAPERAPVFDTQSIEAEFSRSRRFRLLPRDDSSDYTTDDDYPDNPWWYDGREPYTFDDLGSSSWSRGPYTGAIWPPR